MKLDQLNDASGLQLYRLLQDVDIPDFVKDAEVDNEASLDALEKTAYADQINCAYPINTPARVYISNIYFQSKRAELENLYGTKHITQVGEAIKSAAEVFNISGEVEAYNAVAEKRAHQDYELVHVCTINDDDLGETNLFPVKTSAEFVKSADVAAQNMHKYPFEWREEISKGFVTKSAAFGVDELPDIICKYAGLFFPDHTKNIANELVRRASKLSSKEGQDNLNKLAEAVADSEFESIAEAMKVARIAQRIEELDGAYDRPKTAELLPDPVDVFFPLPATKVAEILNVVDMAGEKYHMNSLKKVSAARYKEAFGVDIDPSNEEQLRDVLPTMPLSDVSLFKELTGVQAI